MKAKAFFSLSFLLLLMLFSACEEDDLRTLSYEDSKLQYNRSVTRMEANTMGRYLKDKGYFEKGNEQELIISKNDFEYKILWEVESDFIPKPEALAYFYRLRDSLRAQINEKNSLRMELYSNRSRYERWELLEKMPPFIETEKHVIFYPQSFDLTLVEQIGETLDKQDFFNPDGEVFRIEEDKSSLFLGLASGIRRSNAFKLRFSELRSSMLPDLSKADIRLIFEIRGPLLDRIDESISAPFYPNQTSANGISIKYDDSITQDDLGRLREFISVRRIQEPEWIVFLQTDNGREDRYKLIMPYSENTSNWEELERAKNFARGMSQFLGNKFVDLELLDEATGTQKRLTSESL